MVLIVPSYTQSSYQTKDHWTATVQYAMIKTVKQYRECAKQSYAIRTVFSSVAGERQLLYFLKEHSQ